MGGKFIIRIQCEPLSFSLCLLSFILSPCTTIRRLAPSPSLSLTDMRHYPPPEELSFLMGEVLQPQPSWGLSAANLTLLNLSSLCRKQLCFRNELESAQQMQVISSKLQWSCAFVHLAQGVFGLLGCLGTLLACVWLSCWTGFAMSACHRT